MTNFKRFLSIFLVSSIVLTSSVYAESEALSKENIDISISSVLDEYFDKRECDFNVSEQFSMQSIAYRSQSEEIPNEEMRPYLISKMEEKLELTVVSANTTYSVSEMSVQDDIVYLDVYEWTYVDYTRDMERIDPEQLTDTFGYGVDHKIMLKNNSAGYEIISDNYDEGRLTGMSSSLSQEKFRELIQAEYPVCNITAVSETAPQSVPERSVSGYNPYAAVSYADKYAKKYNTAYVQNGDKDCTNYVSQCLSAGGVPMNNTGDSNTGWWYNKGYYSGSWITAPYNFDYFSALHVSYSNIGDGSYIIPGNPVYYDWNSDGSINHATICVGYDLYGVPLVDSHSDDQYRVSWKYDNGNTRYGTVRITNDDILGTVSGAASLELGVTYYAKLDNTSDIDCFKFIPSQTKQYTFTTTGKINTYGKLCSSSGTVLKTDEDSGTSSNFSITQTLTKGQTYYVYVSSSYPIQGFYGLKVS